MGLDNFWMKTESGVNEEGVAVENVCVSFEKEEYSDLDASNICGGMFSGGGASFRGKVYTHIVKKWRKAGLYTDSYIDTDEVLRIGEALKAYTWTEYLVDHSLGRPPEKRHDGEKGFGPWGLSEREFMAFKRLWSYWAEKKNVVITAWY